MLRFGIGPRIRNSRVVFVSLQKIQSAPAPVHPMVLNQALVVQFHHLHKVHLAALGSLSRVFPHELPSVAEIAGPMTLAKGWLPLGHLFEEGH
jgi:hypothetical protein